jgi:hypothetical protein
VLGEGSAVPFVSTLLSPLDNARPGGVNACAFRCRGLQSLPWLSSKSFSPDSGPHGRRGNRDAMPTRSREALENQIPPVPWSSPPIPEAPLPVSRAAVRRLLGATGTNVSDGNARCQGKRQRKSSQRAGALDILGSVRTVEKSARDRAWRAHRTPEPCSECGSTERVHRHHPDYRRPLDIVWLCSACHGAEHRGGSSFVAPACPRCGDLVDGDRCPCGAGVFVRPGG